MKCKILFTATGSCVLEYKDSESDLKLTLVGWRGVHSLRAYTATPDTVHYLRLLGADTTKYGEFSAPSMYILTSAPLTRTL